MKKLLHIILLGSKHFSSLIKPQSRGYIDNVSKQLLNVMKETQGCISLKTLANKCYSATVNGYVISKMASNNENICTPNNQKIDSFFFI